jgi:hypothetical protein
LSALSIAAEGCAVLSERSLVVYDARGDRVTEHALETPAESVARFGDEWLVLGQKQKQLTRVADGAAGAFASGRVPIAAFGVGRDDAVAVARGDAIELWSRDDKKKWTSKGGPFLRAVPVRDHVVALDPAGALVFFGRDRGEAHGALRLASPEPPESFWLVHVDGNVAVLSLGEWLVWIDAASRKTIRRVRARSKVVALAADASFVVAAVEDDVVQSFQATTGEPLATFGGEGVRAIVLGATELFMLAGETVRACERALLGAAQKVASPTAAVAARGSLAALADRAGVVKVLAAPALREEGVVHAGDAIVGVHVTKADGIVLATSRAILHLPPPWRTPRIVPIRIAPTAFAADDAYAFAGTPSGGVDVYDLGAAKLVTTYALSSDDRITALVRPAGALLVVGTGALDGRVLVVDVAEAKVAHRISPHDEAFGVTCLAADARGRIVASGSDDGTIGLIDPAKGRVLARIRVNETPKALAFEPSGRRLACVFADGTAAIATFAQKGTTLADLGLRGVTHVAWGDSLVFGFKDGRTESGDRHAAPSDRPQARSN